MAGGAGVRFWPLSRNSHPKQFIDVLGTGKTLIQQTFNRFRKLIDVENIFVVTSQEYFDVVHEQLPELKADQILLEPSRRNTAPCIAYANYRIALKNPNANIIVAPSDHLILDEEAFLKAMEQGLDFTETNEALLTIGITPSRPETGYGYIQVKKIQRGVSEIQEVKTFTEKPNLEMAKVFLESGEFLWNSGIFIWKLSSIQASFSRFLPDVDLLFRTGKDSLGTPEEPSFIQNTYQVCRSISIDYGIMEKASNVFVLSADFGWSDLGTWGSLYQHGQPDEQGNVVQGDKIFAYDNSNCIIRSSGNKVMIVKGLQNFIVIESEGNLLICPMDEEQSIREMVEDVRKNLGSDSL